MRKILASALCLLMLCASALAETYTVDVYGSEESPAYAILLSDDGTLLTPIHTCSSIYQLTPRGTPDAEKLFSVTPVNVDIAYTPELAEELLYDMDSIHVALMNGDGRLLTGFDYDGLDYVNGAVIFTLPDDARHCGAMDAAGNVIVEPVYAALRPLRDGAWLALTFPEAFTDPYDALCGAAYIDAAGNVRDLGLHTRDRYLDVDARGVAVLGNVEEYDGKTVFIGPDGDELFDRQFQYADTFIGNYAVVEDNDRYGVIDATGKTVLPLEYDYINREPGKPIIALRGSYYAAYDPEDFALLVEEDLSPEESVSAVAITPELLGISAGDRSWVRAIDGEVLSETPEDKSVWMYGVTGENVTRLVQEDKAWPGGMARLIDLYGNPVSGDYRMILGGTWQDGRGRFITGDYRILTDADGNETVDWTSYRYGLIDDDGNALLPQIYDELRALSFDRFWAVQGDQSGMIDAAGKWYFAVSDYVSLMD